MSHVRYERISTTNNSCDDTEEIELDSTPAEPNLNSRIGSDDEDNGYVIRNGRNINSPLKGSNFHQLNSNESGIGTITKLAPPSAQIMQMAIGTLATILLYLFLSITLTFYQNSLVKKLKFPISIVSYHLVIKFFLAALARAIYKCRVGKSRVVLDWKASVRKMAPTGIASGIDIGFSNWGLEFVPISLYTMTKSTTIVFILFFAILLGLEKKSWSLVFIVGLIATGLFMFTYKSTQFDALGFIFILVASLSSGIRWSFAQFVMQKTKLGLHNPIDMIYYMQPWMIASLLPFLIGFEGQKLYEILTDCSNISLNAFLMVFLKITLGALLAFLMEVSEFLVLLKTSSLTLSIAGIFKDLCQLALAVEINNDQLSLTNGLGLVVCLGGIVLHLIHKYSTLTKVEEENNFPEEDYRLDESNKKDTLTLEKNPNQSNFSATLNKNQEKHHSSLTVPLLEETDSDDSRNGSNSQNASDVIFDVLKRRDMRR